MGRNEEALERAIERWNAGDLDAYLQVYDEGALLHGFAPQPLDKQAARAYYESIFAAFPGAQVELHETFGVDDRLVSRFTLSGTHDGPFMGLPASGTPITMAGITVLHFRAGLVVERWTATDTLGLLVQLGAVPAPA